MSICIANSLGISRDHKIVCVCDMMVANEFVSADHSAFKLQWVKDRWVCMFAGSISPAVPIMASITSAAHVDKFEEMVKISMDAFAKQRTLAIEQSILSPFGLSLSEFMKARNDLGDSNFDSLKYQIENFDLGIELLLAGFDKHEEPHIFSIADRCPIQYHDTLGFHAIGTGSTSAMGMLYNTRNRWATEEESIYRTFEAKFVSEPAPGVGKDTFAVILGPQGQSAMFTADQTERIKKMWERLGKPKLPKKIIESVAEEIKKARQDETNSQSPQEP